MKLQASYLKAGILLGPGKWDIYLATLYSVIFIFVPRLAIFTQDLH